MKLLHKIFLCFILIFGISFQIAGYLLIDFAYDNTVEQQKKYAFQEFQYNKYILQSILYSQKDFLNENGADISDKQNFTVPVAIYGADKKCLFTNIEMKFSIPKFEEKEDATISYWITQENGESAIFVYDCIRQDENTIYLITQTDISPVVDTQRNMTKFFQRIYLMILCIASPIILLLTSLITHSIKKVSKAAKRIAQGSYSERIAVYGKDEIGELAHNFNQMAEKMEEKITELSDAARAKEDFVANFSHELKTPLTSVIGYADMMYQKDLPREQVKNAAEYILNEGMRLESLSLKLMELFVLDKQDFIMEEISVRELFQDLVQGIEPICRKYGIKLHMKIEQGNIAADYDLFKTMILNLVDNAAKADCRDIWITGETRKERYQIQIADNGRGIPAEEIGRITEAFYMVDKSRARKQHGAGLGLALVSKIAEIHKAGITINSDGKTGTVISIAFRLQEGD